MIRGRLAEHIKSIEKNPDFKEEKMLLRTTEDLYKVVMTLGTLNNLENDDSVKETSDVETKYDVPKILTEKMTVSDWFELLSDNSIPLRSGALRELTGWGQFLLICYINIYFVFNNHEKYC